MTYDVSVIVPVYNSEKYIDRCIKSILEQTYKNFELILINDGSKDNSINILNKYKKKDKRISIIDKKNEGVAKTRNLGIQKAKGKYVIFIDNDDFINKNYVETYYKIIKEKKLDIVIGGYERVNSKGKVIKRVEFKNRPFNKEMIYKICSPWAKIYKKSFLIKNSIQFLSGNLGEDNYFNLQALLISKNIFTTDYVGYKWYFNDESISNTIQKGFEASDVLLLLDNCYNVIKRKKLIEEYYDFIENYLYVYIVWYLCYSQRKYTYKDISKNYELLFNWLKDKFPNYKKNKYIGFKLKDETFINKLFLNTFKIFNNFNVGKLFIYLYTRF